MNIMIFKIDFFYNTIFNPLSTQHQNSINMFNQIKVQRLSHTLDILMQIYGFKGIKDFTTNSYLSGSSAVKLLKGEKIVNFNDLDIYIEGGLSHHSANLFAENLMNAGYIKNNKKFEYVKSCLMKSNDEYLNIDETHEYFSLKDHITKILSLSKGNMKIDIIIMKESIEELILNVFDYDIVKNYIKIHNCDDYVYVNNINSIDKKHATMKLSHFRNRILDNAYEFNNFIRRFMKYKMQHNYSIFIENLEITDEIFINILNIVLTKVKDIEFNMSKELLEKGVIAEVLYEETVYNMQNLNVADAKFLFNSIYCIFKEKTVHESINKLITGKPIHKKQTTTHSLFKSIQLRYKENLLKKQIASLIKLKPVSKLLQIN